MFKINMKFSFFCFVFFLLYTFSACEKDDTIIDSDDDKISGGGISTGREIWIEGNVTFRNDEQLAGLLVTFDGITETCLTDADGDFALLINESDAAQYNFSSQTELCPTIYMNGNILYFSDIETNECDKPFDDGDWNFDFNTLRLGHYATANLMGKVIDKDDNDIYAATVEFDLFGIPDAYTDVDGDFDINVSAQQLYDAGVDEWSKEICIHDATSGSLSFFGTKCRNGVDGVWDFGEFTIE